MATCIIYKEKETKDDGRASRHYQLVHGFSDDKDEDTVSMVDLLMTGKGQFSGLYDTDDLVINAATNEERNEGVQLILKPSMSRHFKKRLTVGDEITKALIEQACLTRKGLLTGRTLKKQADAVLRNGKKALSIAVKYLDKEGKPPSGTTIEDYENHILDGMFKLLSGKFDLQGEKESNDNDDNDNEGGDEEDGAGGGRKASWMFHGWIAFLLTGPMAPKEYQSDLWAEKDVEPTPGEGKKSAVELPNAKKRWNGRTRSACWWESVKKIFGMI
jgi:hypothetical protein